MHGGGGGGGKRARIEIIPLIDIIFFLLATFIMVSLSMTKNQGVQVALPSASSAASLGDQQEMEKAVTLTVTDKGDIFYNKDKITLAQLPLKLQAFKTIAEGPEGHHQRRGRRDLEAARRRRRRGARRSGSRRSASTRTRNEDSAGSSASSSPSSCTRGSCCSAGSSSARTRRRRRRSHQVELAVGRRGRREEGREEARGPGRSEDDGDRDAEEAPDAAEVVRNLEVSAAAAAPELEAVSLAAIEQALSGRAAARRLRRVAQLRLGRPHRRHRQGRLARREDRERLQHGRDRSEAARHVPGRRRPIRPRCAARRSRAS